jgi:hypothetical protein
MKKILFGLIATVMFTGLSFGQSVIKFSDYGLYHNEVLTDFSTKYGENQKDVDFIIDEGLKIMQIKHPELFKNVDVLLIKRLFVVKNTNEFDFKKIWNTNKGNLSQNNIPLKVVGLIDEIVNNDLQYDEAIAKMDNFEKTNKLNSEEFNSLVAIRSVLVASNQYWNSVLAKNGSAKPKPGSKTLIADFAGAAMFCFTGPVAAICGFACSYITHQNDN